MIGRTAATTAVGDGAAVATAAGGGTVETTTVAKGGTCVTVVGKGVAAASFGEGDGWEGTEAEVAVAAD